MKKQKTMSDKEFGLLKESLEEAIEISKSYNKNEKSSNQTQFCFILDEDNAISEEMYDAIEKAMRLGAIKNLAIINAPKYPSKDVKNE